MNNCKEFILNLVSTIPHHFPSPFNILLILSITIALAAVIIQIYKTKKYVKDILKNSIPLPPKIRKIAQELGIEKKLMVAKTGLFTSFCFGLILPKICLNYKFALSLTQDELKAVLLHEIHHLKNYDPLKIFLAQALQSCIFFIPLSKDLQNYYLLSREIAADRQVLKLDMVSGLRNALIKSFNLPEANFILARFFTEHTLEQRVKILTSSSKSIHFKLSYLRLFISLMVIISYFIFAQLPIYAVDNGNDHSYYYCTGSQRLFSPANYSPAN